MVAGKTVTERPDPEEHTHDREALLGGIQRAWAWFRNSAVIHGVQAGSGTGNAHAGPGPKLLSRTVANSQRCD